MMPTPSGLAANCRPSTSLPAEQSPVCWDPRGRHQLAVPTAVLREQASAASLSCVPSAHSSSPRGPTPSSSKRVLWCGEDLERLDV